ncbi:Dihydrofolate synthase @ Folylpolyglutamate synthase [hydrothermal vent metagenome]|uniref:tetrahydrofolate synthase n=1 Tax=hydrothermal vent metagenome TaxID=652676 RepID=A0A3B0SMJ0_9ZZZZ
MAVVDAILQRLLQLHPKVIDLTLQRLERLLKKLDHPERKLPPVIHVAGTNGKGSTIAFMKAMLEAAGLAVHIYSSPHLVTFNERIYLGSKGLIGNEELSELLEECERVNGSSPITFFEITTAAAFLAFSRHPADYVLLETGLGGRLDATNVIEKPAACAITPIDLDHQQYLGETITEIAGEKAGILKTGVPATIALQLDEVREVFEKIGAEKKVPLSFANQDWQAYEQHGRLVFQNENELLDLPMPGLIGQHQIVNAGTAIATLQSLGDSRVTAKHFEMGLSNVQWPARLQKLEPGELHEWAPAGSEIWLDGGHNPAAGQALAIGLAGLNDRSPRPLVLIIGMLNTKDPIGYFEAFEDMAHVVFTVSIPNEENALSAEVLTNIALQANLDAYPQNSVKEALNSAAEFCNAPRILIGGSLYLAGNVLAEHRGQEVGLITGTRKI